MDARTIKSKLYKHQLGVSMHLKLCFQYSCYIVFHRWRSHGPMLLTRVLRPVYGLIKGDACHHLLGGCVGQSAQVERRMQFC